MDLNSPEFAQFLDKLIDQKVSIKVEQKLKEYGNVRAWDSIIVSVSGNTASVKLIGESTIIPNIKNKSGVVLVAGDEVYLFSLSSLTNAFIAVAKNKP